VLSGDRIFTILQRLNLEEKDRYSSEDLVSIAKLGGADYLVKGNYIKVGDRYIITVMLQKPQTGEVVGSIKKESTSEAELPSKVDELTRYIKLDLKLTSEQIASDMDKDVGKITTSSHEAYKYYIEGAKYNNLGEYRLGLQFLERAISIDPEFAMAYRIMAACYADLGYYSKWEESIQKALGLLNRISERERLLIQGNYYTWSWSGKRLDKAISLDPLSGGNIMLKGDIFCCKGEMIKAEREYQKLLESEEQPDHLSYALKLSSLYLLQGRFMKSKDLVK